jgi:voltage-gated potassium channel
VRRHPFITAVLLAGSMLLLYFVFPLDPDRAPVGVLMGMVLSLVAMVGMSIVVVTEVRRPERRLTVIQLVLALEAVIMSFSAAYYVVGTTRSDEFEGMATRLDALYFSMTTLSTVGYGDVHAVGQFARALVTVHIAFNLLFVGAFAGLIRDTIERRKSATEERRS